MKFTKRAIDRLPAPDPSGKQKLKWDDELKGFGVLISGKTASKTFIVQQRLRDGKSRRVTIGATNALDIAEARAEARRVIGDIYKGIDPKAGRAKKISIPTPVAALESYLAERRDLAPATARMYRAAIARLGPLAGRPLSEITADDVAASRARVRDAIAAGPGRPYEGKAAAALSVTVLGTVWRWAARRNPEVPPNPVPILSGRGYTVARRTGHIPASRLADWYAATARLEPIWRDYLRVLLFTGMRRNEAAALAWSEVDFAAKVIRLPATRTKARRPFELPMCDLVHELLVARRALGDAKFVFPANSESSHLEEPKFALRAVKADCGVGVSAHDLRRTFLSVAQETDVNWLKLKMLVNHAAGADVTVGYIQVSMDALRAAAQTIADSMKEHCGIARPEGVLRVSSKRS